MKACLRPGMNLAETGLCLLLSACCLMPAAGRQSSGKPPATCLSAAIVLLPVMLPASILTNSIFKSTTNSNHCSRENLSGQAFFSVKLTVDT
jgi:hypothetical protein